MPLDRYREQCGGGTAHDAPSQQTGPPGEEEPSIEVNAALRADPDSWWETKDGECPPPPLDWDVAY
jgi:hypothetical protein